MTGFLAPEYAAGRPARCESDLYSLGVLLLALALGRPSLDVSQGLQDMRTLSLSPGLRVLLRSMLAEEPGRRPEAHTVYEKLVGIQDVNALMGFHTWRPPARAETFLGAHPIRSWAEKKRWRVFLAFGAGVNEARA
jgi:serine/threonine protein kinase